MFIKKILIASAIATTSLFAATAYQNQIGFLTNGQKQMAVIDAAGQDIVFKDESGKEVLTVKAPDTAFWAPAGEGASLVDFSELNVPGTYQAFVGDEVIGHPIVIGDNAFEEIAKASIKFFYFQRCSMELTEEFAGKYARAMGHPDTAVRYHEELNKEAFSTFYGAKGWYDAGDYGKYIVNSGISTYTLLQLYKQNSEYFNKLNLNIPESNNDVPDLLDEIRWNLEWMLTMQDVDGGVFHKLTTKQFSGEVMPAQDVRVRFAIGKSITATWNFVAVMAVAADIYYKYDPEFATKCAKAAEFAYAWGLAYPNEKFVQPKDVGTGTYTDNSATDERIWAAAELYRISRNPGFKAKMQEVPMFHSRTFLQSWSSTYMLTAYTVATNPDYYDAADVDSANYLVKTLADKYIAQLEHNGYGVALDETDFYWGSNGGAANKGMALIHAYILTKDEKYYNAAVGLLDYLLGRNPLDKSYLTGFGVNKVMHPHHRPSTADGIEDPVPGMLAGGPNKTANDTRECKVDYLDEKAPAKSYLDDKCSYASNEVAINWNAPFAYLSGSLQAIASTGKTYDVSGKSAEFELSKIAKSHNALAPVRPGQKLMVRDNSVQVKKTDIKGNIKFFDMNGKTAK
ncbi:MAG: glycoside hydrolase family 9 protein [Fibrobacter sp.]|nr:glycoside hydrolase family 9 protein [Fibrobacter sp.]